MQMGAGGERESVWRSVVRASPATREPKGGLEGGRKYTPKRNIRIGVVVLSSRYAEISPKRIIELAAICIAPR